MRILFFLLTLININIFEKMSFYFGFIKNMAITVRYVVVKALNGRLNVKKIGINSKKIKMV